ncbi:hypothetical protein EDB92DRAFT_1942798 [Lactarius akahatsu]|uniref:Uncharacterized protein n=1 Tax=Lactarius akahatsu TaxID=416441 RepID=A0AAD4LP57_9AGAM|nr:hypothetical protein EDB92DRAFT_1942798 [Lactarius akahatsu]
MAQAITTIAAPLSTAKVGGPTPLDLVLFSWHAVQRKGILLLLSCQWLSPYPRVWDQCSQRRLSWSTENVQFVACTISGLQISGSTVLWFDHNDPKSPEDVLLSIEKEHRRRREPVTRRFIVTEAMVDLPKLAEPDTVLRNRITSPYASLLFRFFVCWLNSTAKATQIDMIIGSVANTLNSSGGFCAGSRIVVDPQHILHLFRRGPAQENVRAIWAVLDQVEAITIPSHAASPIIHICLRSAATLSASASTPAKPPNPATPAPHDAPSFDIAGEECLLQDIVDEALAQGV